MRYTAIVILFFVATLNLTYAIIESYEEQVEIKCYDENYQKEICLKDENCTLILNKSFDCIKKCQLNQINHICCASKCQSENEKVNLQLEKYFQCVIDQTINTNNSISFCQKSHMPDYKTKCSDQEKPRLDTKDILSLKEQEKKDIIKCIADMIKKIQKMLKKYLCEQTHCDECKKKCEEQSKEQLHII